MQNGEAICPYCGGNSRFLFSAEDYNQRLSRSKFNYYRCSSCRLIFISPVPGDLDIYYTQACPAYERLSPEEFEVGASLQKDKLAIVQRFVQSGRLLEIGPASGSFAYLAKKAGFDVEAIEMDAECCRYLQDVLHISTIHTSNPVEALQGLGKFDVIVMWHVIEHLPNLREVLDSLPGQLNPGGILLIAAPNPDAFQFKMFGKYWTHLDAPRHLRLIPMRLLSVHMERMGLSLLSWTTKDFISLLFSTFGWWKKSFRNFLNGIYLFETHPVPGEVVQQSIEQGKTFSGRLRGLLEFIGRAVLRNGYSVLRLFEIREGAGCAYIVIYRKNLN